MSESISDEGNVLGGGRQLEGPSPAAEPTSRNVLFQSLERRTTEALLSSPRSGHPMFTQFTFTLQFWGGKEEQELQRSGLGKAFLPPPVKRSQLLKNTYKGLVFSFGK